MVKHADNIDRKGMPKKAKRSVRKKAIRIKGTPSLAKGQLLFTREESIGHQEYPSDPEQKRLLIAVVTAYPDERGKHNTFYVGLSMNS